MMKVRAGISQNEQRQRMEMKRADALIMGSGARHDEEKDHRRG